MIFGTPSTKFTKKEWRLGLNPKNEKEDIHFGFYSIFGTVECDDFKKIKNNFDAIKKEIT